MAGAGTALAGGIAGGIVGAKIQESIDDQKRSKEATERLTLADFPVSAAIKRPLKEGGSVKMDLKLAPGADKLVGFVEFFDKNGKAIPGLLSIN